MAPVPDPALRVTELHPAPGVTLLQIDGDLDLASAPVLREVMAAVVTDHLVVDVGRVGFLACSGLRVLQDCARQRPTALIGAAHPPVAALLRLVGPGPALTVHPSLAAALAADLPADSTGSDRADA